MFLTHRFLHRLLSRLLILACVVSTTPAFAAERLPNQIHLNGQTMEKVGEHRYYYKMFFKLYDAALYSQPGTPVDSILQAKQAFRLQFRYLREIEKSIILKSASKMLERNLSIDELAQINNRVAQLNEVYITVDDGDYSSLTFQPGKGTTLNINGTDQVTIPGDDFARLYFEIWLGDNPTSKDLKKNLLGG